MRALALATVLFLAACGGPERYSEDPDIAMKQKWVVACGQMKQGVVTALTLGKAGALSESELQTMDRVKLIYVTTCTADPAPLGSALTGTAVLLAVGELCPELIVHEDFRITIAMASVCAARQALLKQLEKST